jgi:HEAT repeat protein
MERVFPEDVQCQRWIDELKNGTTVSRLDAVTGLSHSPGPGCLRALVETLDDSQFPVRKAAFDALSLAEGRAVPALVEMLADERDGIAWRSALLLGGFRSGAAVPGLIGLLERNGKVRLCEIWALGEIGNKDSITPLMRFLDHNDPLVREETIKALKKIGQI